MLAILLTIRHCDGTASEVHMTTKQPVFSYDESFSRFYKFEFYILNSLVSICKKGFMINKVIYTSPTGAMDVNSHA